MRIALAAPENHESLVDLLHELNAYYHPASPVSRQIVRQHLTERLLGEASPIKLVVATDGDGRVVGFAAVVLLHSLVEPEPQAQGQCLLKELFVSQACRGAGVGHAIMGWVARFAVDHGCSRMDWNVNAENLRGRAFYERLGARSVIDRMSCRLSRSPLENLAARGDREAGA